jgi:hypothetical protein
MDSPGVKKTGVAGCKFDPGSAGHIRMSGMGTLSYAQFLRRVPASLGASDVFKLPIGEKCDSEVNADMLLYSHSFQNSVRREKLSVSMPFAVVRLHGIVEVLSVMKQRHFPGKVPQHSDDTIVGDKFQQLQQIIFARPEISLLGEISDISRPRTPRIFFDGLLKHVIANAA